jgi:hypothetical protein
VGDLELVKMREIQSLWELNLYPYRMISTSSCLWELFAVPHTRPVTLDLDTETRVIWQTIRTDNQWNKWLCTWRHSVNLIILTKPRCPTKISHELTWNDVRALMTASRQREQQGVLGVAIKPCSQTPLKRHRINWKFSTLCPKQHSNISPNSLHKSLFRPIMVTTIKISRLLKFRNDAFRTEITKSTFTLHRYIALYIYWYRLFISLRYSGWFITYVQILFKLNSSEIISRVCKVPLFYCDC